jgi:hypothetical protein
MFYFESFPGNGFSYQKVPIYEINLTSCKVNSSPQNNLKNVEEEFGLCPNINQIDVGNVQPLRWTFCENNKSIQK